MVHKSMILFLIAAIGLGLSQNGWGQSFGTAITYQGKLSDGGGPVNGEYDFGFELYDEPNEAGVQVGPTITKENINVGAGTFTVALDFGSGIFTGDARWLQIGVRPGEQSDPCEYTTLSPRQELTPTPYALHAQTVESIADGDTIGGAGTSNYVPKFIAAKTLDDSVLYESAGNIGIGTTSPAVRLDVNGDVNVSLAYQIEGDTVLAVTGVNNNNTFVGVETGTNNTGNYNTFIGQSAGSDNTTGIQNTFVGADAGSANTTGKWNTFLGYTAGLSNVSGLANTFVGYNAGYNNTDGMNNTFIGRATGINNTTGENNSFLGHSAGNSNTTGSYNTFMGNLAGYSNTEGDFSTFIGHSAGRFNTTGTNNTFLGNSSGYFNTTGAYNTFVGTSTGFANTTGSFNTFLGVAAGTNNTTGTDNSFFGYRAGYRNDIGASNVFMGYNAGPENTQGDENTFVGTEAGRWNTTGYQNTFVGHKAGMGSSTGYGNTFIGKSAGQTTSTGIYNTFLGLFAGHLNNTGTNNTFLGAFAGRLNTTGNENTFIGISAGSSNASGQRNTFIGHRSGFFNTTGDGSVFIGYEAGAFEEDPNRLYIANSNTHTPLIYGEFDHGLLTFNGDVGIGTASPAEMLDVAGSARIAGSLTLAESFVDSTASAGTPGQVLTSTGTVTAWSDVAAETDPVFTASDAAAITDANIINWNTAYNWGDHAAQGYLTSIVEDDPQVGSNTLNYAPAWDGSALVKGTIYDNGSIGIGTINPSRKLYINNGGLGVFAGTSGESVSFTTGSLSVQNNNEDPMMTISETPSDYITFHNGGTSVMKIADGKVGIGGANPGYKLHVNGDINYTGALYKNGSPFKEVIAGELSGVPPAYPFTFDISSLGNVLPADVIVVVSGFKTDALGTPLNPVMIRWQVTNSPYTLTVSLRVFDGVTGAEFDPSVTAPPEWINNRVELSFVATASDT